MQSRVDDHGLGVADEIGKDRTPQGLQEMAQLPDPAVQRRRPKPHDSGEQMREKPFDVAQEGTLGLNSSKLLQEGEGYNLRVRELLQGFVMLRFRIEDLISVVYDTEQNDDRLLHLFREHRVWGKLGLGHLKLLWTGNALMALVLPYKPRNTHLAIDMLSDVGY